MPSLPFDIECENSLTAGLHKYGFVIVSCEFPTKCFPLCTDSTPKFCLFFLLEALIWCRWQFVCLFSTCGSQKAKHFNQAWVEMADNLKFLGNFQRTHLNGDAMWRWKTRVILACETLNLYLCLYTKTIFSSLQSPTIINPASSVDDCHLQPNRVFFCINKYLSSPEHLTLSGTSRSQTFGLFGVEGPTQSESVLLQSISTYVQFARFSWEKAESQVQSGKILGIKVSINTGFSSITFYAGDKGLYRRDKARYYHSLYLYPSDLS